MSALLRILALWRGRLPGLAVGLILSLLALAAAVGLMAAAGARVASLAVAGGAVAVAAAPLLRLLGVGRVLLRYAERLATHDATFHALADLRVWFFRGLAERAAGGLGFRHAGDMLARLAGDVEALDGLYIRILLPLLGAVLLLPALVLLLGRGDPALAVVIGGLFAAAAFALPLLAARAAATAGERLAAAGAGLRVAALDTLTGLREVRAFAAEGRMMERVQARETALLDTQQGLAARAAWARAGAMLCGQAAVFAVLLTAGSRPLTAAVAAFLTVAAFEAVGLLPQAGVLAGHAAAAARRVLEAAEGPIPYPDPARPAPLPAGSALRFEAAEFRWQPDRPAIFEGLSLDIPQGSRVAILGPSGSGKSSLAALALKVVAPQRGTVRLGGADLATLAAGDIRRRIAWLSQATHLFDDTIRANLLLGRPDASEAALWAALDQAAVGEVVRGLPEGLETWVGEGGTRFSGGQGRRLALARTLLSEAPVLILDEPCAGLDAETEKAFFTTLYAAAAGRTVLLIAHRLTGAERLDRIWRLSNCAAIAAAA
jgi:ATP-binding cassette subfamily C protein CydC